jgi:hypothetical protein
MATIQEVSAGQLHTDLLSFICIVLGWIAYEVFMAVKKLKHQVTLKYS